MWNVEGSIDFGCMGLAVFSHYERYADGDIFHYFNIHWTDDSLVEYDHEEIEQGKLKVVKF
jgi:aminoglycoside phosphotransferase